VSVVHDDLDFPAKPVTKLTGRFMEESASCPRSKYKSLD